MHKLGSSFLQDIHVLFLSGKELKKINQRSVQDIGFAQVVELVDTRDLKSLEGNFVPVRVRPWAPFK
tara:strand:+ start:77 stop:277 length:201 start_codon:yes stop_codon:yes gene_type:complete